jgi:hypothetical protein
LPAITTLPDDPVQAWWSWRMSDTEIARKLAELDRLLNDPETRMDAGRVWALAQELKAPAAGAGASRRH